MENPLKVAPLIQSNLTPVKFFHSSILFILVFFVFFLSVMPGSTLNFVYKYNDSFYFYICVATLRRALYV